MDRLWQLIKSLLKAGDLNKECEKKILELKERNKAQFVIDLVEILAKGEKNEKIFCCVMIRQSFCVENLNNELWDILNDSEKNFVQVELLRCLLNETEWEVTKLICTCISELGILLFTRYTQWEGLTEWLLRGLNENETIKSAVFQVLSEICVFIHSEIFEFFTKHAVETCKSALRSQFWPLCSSAFIFICKYSAVLNEDELEDFSEIIEICLDSVSLSKNETNGENLARVLRELAESNPAAFKGKMCYIGCIIKNVGRKDFLNLLNILFNIFQILCSSLYEEVLNDQSLIHSVFIEIYSFMIKTSNEIENDWLYPEVDNENIESDPIEIDYSVIGAKHVSSIIESIGEEQTIPEVLDLIKTELKSWSDDWRISYACLLILTELGQFVDSSTSLSEILEIFPSMFLNLNPKGKCAFFGCVSRFSHDFHEEFTEKYFFGLFPLLLNSLFDPIPKTVSESLKSLKSLCSNLPKALAEYYLPHLFPILFSHLSHTNSSVINSTLSLSTTIFIYPEASNSPYFIQFQAKLLEIIKNSEFSSFLRGKALETAAILCTQHLNKDSKLYCHSLLQIIKHIKNVELFENHPFSAFVLSALHKLSSIYPQDLIEYIADTLPNLYTILKKIENNDDLVTSQESSVQVLALETLLAICKNLKEYFYPFINNTAETVYPYLKNTKNASLREKSAEILPFLLYSSKASLHHLVAVGKDFLIKLWDSLLAEYDIKVRTVQITAIKSILEIIDHEFMTSEEILITWKNLFGIIEFMYKDVKSGGSFAITEEIEENYSAISDFIGTLFKTHKNLCVFIVDDICSKVFPMFLNYFEPIVHKKFAVFIIDDIIEHFGQNTFIDKWNLFAETIFIYSEDNEHSLRQAALYGLGLLAEFTSVSLFEKWKSRVLDILHNSIHYEPMNKSKEFIHAQENAVSALGKVIKYQGANFDLNVLIPAFVKLLPLRNDFEEGKKMHDFLADLCLTCPKTVFGSNFEYGGLVLDILAVVVDSQVCENFTVFKIRKVFEYMWEAWQEEFKVKMSEFSDIQQLKIKSLMNIG